ncbi:MAG: hypothetical protein U1E67_05435 [Hyphomicrobiales bacterium]
MSSIDDMLTCPVTLYAALPSPDRSKQVVLFDVDCGATTGFNTQVAIAPVDVTFDREVTPAVLIMDGRWSLPIRWIDERTLRVRIPEGVRIYRRLTSTGDVTILYEEDASPP